MDTHSPGAHVYRFGVFELDTRSGELRRHGLTIRLPDQSFQILKLLLSRPGEVVSREELRRALWTADTFVDFEAGLNSAVRKLREALDDAADSPRFVATVPRHGYRFIGPLTAPTPEPIARPEVLPEQPALAAPPARDLAEQPPVPVSMPSAIHPRRARVIDWRAVALLVIAVVAIMGVAGVFYSRTAAPGDPIGSILVLPFENLTGDAGQGYFVDSVTEAVTAHLAQVEGIDVFSSRTARQYKQTGKSIPEMGKELPVEGVVEATVAGSGESVTVTVKLISTATDRTVWTSVYPTDVSGLLAKQQEIASDLAVAAGRPAARAQRQPSASSLERGAAATRRINPAAYDAYLRGRNAMGLERHEGFSRAVAYFEQAVTLQPDFAEAHAALAVAQLQFLFGGPYAPHQVIPKAEAAARQALKIDDTLPRAHRVLGRMLHLYYWRWDDGDKETARGAMEGDDGLSPITSSLIRNGRFGEAVAVAERKKRLDPLSVQARVSLAGVCTAAGQYDRALEELGRALEKSPGNVRVHYQRGQTLVAMKRLDEAIRDLEIAGRQPTGHNSRMEAYLGYAYAAAGRTQDARKVLAELELHRKDQYVSWFGIGLIHDALGEKAPALAAVQRAFEDRAVEFAMAKQYPPFRTIASDPAYLSIVRQVGLSR